MVGSPFAFARGLQGDEGGSYDAGIHSPRSGAVRRRALLLSALLPLALALAIALPVNAEPLVLDWSAPGGSEGWEVEEFEGETRYRVVELDGRRVLRADSASSASSLYLEREIDLTATPILEWSWRVETPLAVADERSKDGDDFAARLYVVAPGEGLFGLPRAINYVWANRAEVGESWPNPFTSKVMMVAVESGERDAGAWRTYRRDVAPTSSACSSGRWARSKASRS